MKRCNVCGEAGEIGPVRNIIFIVSPDRNGPRERMLLKVCEPCVERLAVASNTARPEKKRRAHPSD